MHYKDFENILLKAKLSKKQFSNLSDTPYPTIMTWYNTNNVPKWVSSWIENYIEAQSLKEIIRIIQPHLNRKDL